MEDAVYDSQSLRKLGQIDLAHESVPGATTLLKFRNLLEANQLPQKMFNELIIRLSRQGVLMCEGTIADATIIQRPKSHPEGGAGQTKPEIMFKNRGNEQKLKTRLDSVEIISYYSGVP